MSRLPGRLVLLGHPLGHSLSPRFQNAALRRAGLALTYETLDVAPDAIPATLEELRRQKAAGNVTIPYKGTVAQGCARLTAVAARVGVVNTFWTERGALVGDNTDVEGFEALAHRVLGERPSGLRVVLLGAGGAAAAVCAALDQWPDVSVLVINRDRGRAERLAQRFASVTRLEEAPTAGLKAADVVINATPVGLSDDSFPVPLDDLQGDAAVIDLAYRPGETAWVRAARARGHRAADGLEMLIVQGARAFERWFGFAPDIDTMRAAIAT